MLLITYKTTIPGLKVPHCAQAMSTLLVDEFRDSYNTSEGWMKLYRVGSERIEIPRDSILAECWLPPDYNRTPYSHELESSLEE